jgi:hypothetical protein
MMECLTKMGAAFDEFSLMKGEKVEAPNRNASSNGMALAFMEGGESEELKQTEQADEEGGGGGGGGGEEEEDWLIDRRFASEVRMASH